MAAQTPPPPPPPPVPGVPTGPLTPKGYAADGREYAPWISRVGAYLIDYIIPALIMIPGIIFGINWNSFSNSTSVCTQMTDGVCTQYSLSSGGFPLNPIYFIFLLLVVAFSIWNRGWRQHKTGKSIGKSVLKLTAVDANTGEYKGFWWLILRQILLGVDFYICYLGVLWPLWDNKRQCLVSDKACSTVVFKDS